MTGRTTPRPITDQDRALGTDALAPQPGLGELAALAERVRSTGLVVSLETVGEPFALSGAAELTIYRIVQEALTNALKHAGSAHSVHISLSFDDPDVTVRIVDDGQPSVAALSSGTPSLVSGAPGRRTRCPRHEGEGGSFRGNVDRGPRR